MNSDLGVWTADDSALVLIDYQPQMFEVIRSETTADLSFATVEALKDGYDAMYVTDAVGGRSQAAHRTGTERLAHAGAVPTTALAVTTEMFRDTEKQAAAAALQGAR